MTNRIHIWRARLDEFSVFNRVETPFAAILCHELVVAFRHRRYAMMLGGLAVALLVAILFDFARMRAGVIPASILVTDVIGLQCSALLVILFFVMPALSAVTVAAERHGETEELLQMALAEPLSLLAGKLFAMVALFSVFHVALLPFSVFTYFFAGMEIKSFFLINFMLYGTALTHCFIGMTISSVTQRPNIALLLTFAILAIMYLLPTLYASVNSTWYLNPIALTQDLLHSVAGWAACLQLLALQTFTATLVTMAASGARLWNPTRNRGQGAIRQGSLSPPRQTPFRPLPDWGNPAYHRDCQTNPLTRPRWAAATFVLGAALTLSFTLWSARYLNLSATASELGSLVLIIVTPLVCLDRWRKETDPTSLLMLRVTRLSAANVLLGKALALFRSLLPLTLGIITGATLPLFFANPLELTGGHPATPSTMVLVYHAALLPPKLALWVVLCFACIRYRAPSATDRALSLVLATLVAGSAELLRIGLFDTVDWKNLRELHFVLLYLGQVITIFFGLLLAVVISILRFGMVFNEGTDAFAAGRNERSSH
jgi:hypothetical protein